MNMQAMGIFRYGGPQELTRLNLPVPRPGEQEVVVRVMASSVNPADLRARAPAASRNIERQFPAVLGYDVYGVVVALGENVKHVQMGAPVIGTASLVSAGANAEYVRMDHRVLAAKPPSLDAFEAGALPLAGVTALETIRRVGALGASATVLIQGAAGGVGHLQVQIAKSMGYRVLCTAGRDESIRFCTRLGADQVIDYRNTDVAAVVRELTGGTGAHVVFDNVGTATIESSLDAVAAMGTVVAIAPAPQPRTEKLFLKAASLTYHLMGAATFWGIDPQAQGRALADLVRLVETGAVRPHVSRVAAIRDLKEAHEALEAGHTIGKLALQVEGGW